MHEAKFVLLKIYALLLLHLQASKCCGVKKRQMSGELSRLYSGRVTLNSSTAVECISAAWLISHALVSYVFHSLYQLQLLYLLQLWYLSYLLHVVAFVEFVHWRLGLSFMLSCCIRRLSQSKFGRSPSQLRNSNSVPAFGLSYPNNLKSQTEQQFLHNF